MNRLPRQRALQLGTSVWLVLLLLLAQPLSWLHGLSHLEHANPAGVTLGTAAHPSADAAEAGDQADAPCLQCLALAQLGSALPSAGPTWQASAGPAALRQAAASVLWIAPGRTPCARGPPTHGA